MIPEETKAKIKLVCDYVHIIGFTGYELLELADELRRED